MFDGVRRGYTLTFLLLMGVIEEIGSDRGLGMLQDAIERQADIVTRELRRKAPKGLGPLNLGAQVYAQFMADAGAEVVVHKRDESSVVFRVARCPFYEALLDIGVDCGYLQSGLCVNLIHPAIQLVLNRFDPRLRLKSEVTRQAAEEFCLECVCITDG